MGTAAYGGKGFKERARVSGERPIGAASFRQQYIQASCQFPHPLAPLVHANGLSPCTTLQRLPLAGDILLNGHVCDSVTFSRFAGYVEQMDIHSSSMTVQEALAFSSFLRLPSEVCHELQSLRAIREADSSAKLSLQYPCFVPCKCTDSTATEHDVMVTGFSSVNALLQCALLSTNAA